MNLLLKKDSIKKREKEYPVKEITSCKSTRFFFVTSSKEWRGKKKLYSAA
jgi:hypothetical protein